MELGHRVARDTSALHERPVGPETLRLHVPQDSAVDRLEAVAHVGQRPGNDDGHGVIQERALYLVLDFDRLDLAELERGLYVAHQISRNLTSRALVWMKCLRNSTSSPISVLMISSASAASA